MILVCKLIRQNGSERSNRRISESISKCMFVSLLGKLCNGGVGGKMVL